MKAPLFWSRPAGLLAALLAPLSAIWAWQTRRRIAGGPHARIGVPVICVGNLTAGGTGKTPTVMHLSGLLGAGAHILLRGHGGQLSGPVQVDPAAHTAADVGDEPLLLCAFAPTWVSKDRHAGAKRAVAAGAHVIVMDDGFQNPSLAKALSVIVVDAEAGFGNERVMPAGPLREPVEAGLARADVVLLIGPKAARARQLSARSWPVPVAEAELKPLQTGMDWAGLPVFAFAGIGRPDKMFATLEALGAQIRGTEAFGDHAPYSEAVLRRLKGRADALGAQLVTTEKDAVRLPPAWRRNVLTLPVRLVFEDNVLDDAIANVARPDARPGE